MKKIHKNILAIKIIGILFLVLSLSLAPIPGRKASAWIDTIIPKVILPPMQLMLDQLMNIITGAAQQAAIKMITQNVYSVVGGSGSGGTKFIKDWKAALETDPQKEAASYIESLSSRSTQMKGSSSYTSADFSLASSFEGVGESGLAQYFQSPRFIDSASADTSGSSSSSYATTLKEIGTSIADQVTNSSPCTITYEGDPAKMFDDGTFKNFSKFMSGKNDPWSYQTCMQNAYEKKLASLEKIAETKAIANQGFIGTGSDGKISYPGILVKEKVANVENMGNEVIVNADGIAKVITSAVIKMGMDAMTNGISGK
jgi:hypothetical protein